MRITFVVVFLVWLSACTNATAPSAPTPSSIISSGSVQFRVEFESTDKSEFDCAKVIAGKQNVDVQITEEKTSSTGAIFTTANDKWKVVLTKQFDATTQDMDHLIASMEKCRSGSNSSLKWTASSLAKGQLRPS
jgi:hypothetical protein